MTWEDVLKRDDIVGGDLETQENGEIFRGPISRIVLKGGYVQFDSPWCARMEDGKWVTWPVYPCSVKALLCSPRDIGNGCVQFSMPFLGFGVIFPKGGSKLDPNEVEGLKITKTTT